MSLSLFDLLLLKEKYNTGAVLATLDEVLSLALDKRY